MQNLKGPQADRQLYLDQDILTPAGSRQYAELYMSGKAPDENGKPKGIPAEDFNNFATVVLILKDHQEELAAKQRSGEKLTHMDFGTGPNLYNIIAGLPYMDKIIAIELAPSNIQTLKGYKTPGGHLPDYWNAWVDFGAILYDLGSAQKLLDMDVDVKIPKLNLAKEPDLVADKQGRINLYDSLRKWPLLSKNTQDLIRKKIYEEADIIPSPDNNPYTPIAKEGLQSALGRTLEVRQGDLFNPLGDDVVPPITDLAGKAHLSTTTLVTESSTRELPKVLHAEANKAQFSRPDGIYVSSHMAGTDGYGGFITVDQLAENPDLQHEECPMSRGLLTRIMNEIVHQDPRYLSLSAGAVPEHRRMVRPEKQYTETVIVAGRANYLNEHGKPKFDNGIQFMNHLRDSVLKAKHVMHYHKHEGGEAVKDFKHQAKQFAQQVGLLGNESVNWDGLSRNFWNKYSEINFDRPIPGDIESMFAFIENCREKKGGHFLDIGTGATPHFAITAAAAGMGKITVSDIAQGARAWLNDELLDNHPMSSRSQMWLDIAKLLSTFKNKDQLLSYCHETGFDKDLRNWQHLTQTEKEYWFNDRRYLIEHGRGGKPEDSFLDSKEDIKAKLKQMHKKGDFTIRKVDILNPPEDLSGQGDVVGMLSMASCLSEKPSEYCKALLNSCRLTKPGGIVSTTYTPYDNWKQYTPEADDLPSIPRHNYYYSVSHSLLFDEHKETCGTTYDRDAVAKEISSIKHDICGDPITFEGTNGAGSLRKPGDTRFEHLIYISGSPKEKIFKDEHEMLGTFQVHMLEKARSFLTEHPNRCALIVDPSLFRSVGHLEKQLGMEVQSMSLPDSLEGRRTKLAQRIDGIMAYMEKNRDSTTTDTLDKQDEAISKFVDSVYERLIGRSASAKMILNAPPFAARR